MKAPRAPALLLGIGLGGFIDGILLHQVLQWHHMLTSTSGHPMTTVAGLEANTLADGLFHLATWICVAAGSALLYTAWRDGRLAPPRRAQLGLLLAGWGLFNLVEGLIDHQLLGVHHVRDDLGGPVGWDLAFLALGAALLLARLGARLKHRRKPRAASLAHVRRRRRSAPIWPCAGVSCSRSDAAGPAVTPSVTPYPAAAALADNFACSASRVHTGRRLGIVSGRLVGARNT